MEMMNFIDNYTYGAGKTLDLKIGIHTGNCIFGVLGYHKPQFSLIGDTVNTTSRHCTTGPSARIILSESTYQILTKTAEVMKFSFDQKSVMMKGKGMKRTFLVRRKSLRIQKENEILFSPKKNFTPRTPKESSNKLKPHLSLKLMKNLHGIEDSIESPKNTLEMIVEAEQRVDNEKNEIFSFKSSSSSSSEDQQIELD